MTIRAGRGDHADRPGGCQTLLHEFERAIQDTPAWEVYFRAIGGEPGGNKTLNHIQDPVTGRFVGDTTTITDKIRNGGTPNSQTPDTIPFPKRDRSNDMPGGTSRIAQIRRIIKEVEKGNIDPVVLERVRSGELTPNRVLVDSGIRLRSITVPDDPSLAADRLKLHFHGERLTDWANPPHGPQGKSRAISFFSRPTFHFGI